MSSRKGDICNSDVHRASFLEHLRSKTHLEIIKQNEMIIPEWLFKELFDKKDIYKYSQINQTISMR